LAHFWTVVCAVHAIEGKPILHRDVTFAVTWLALELFQVFSIFTVPPSFAISWFKYAISVAIAKTSLGSASRHGDIAEFMMLLSQSGKILVDGSIF